MKLATNKLETLRVPSGLREFVNLTLKNSWIPQPDMALGGALSLYSVITARKFIFNGLAPNLYVVNISESGTGKSFPQEEVKRTLAECGAQDLIGSGDYASYAAIMDSLATKPVRLDIWDELGGILKTINSSKDDYTSKMDDILAELYTTSNSYYAGRALASGQDGIPTIKGQCFRPNVCILGSTTPKGFEEGVSQTAIDKGLLGRFLFFRGDIKAKSTRIANPSNLDPSLKNSLVFLTGYRPEQDEGFSVKGVFQNVTTLEADDTANKMLDSIFKEFDSLRLKSLHKPIGPIVSRLYQQMVKLVMIHSLSRNTRSVPIIDKHDVMFGYELMLLQYKELSAMLKDLIFSSKESKERRYLLKQIEERSPINKKELIKLTPDLGPRKRNSVIEELIESGLVLKDVVKDGDSFETIFYRGF